MQTHTNCPNCNQKLRVGTEQLGKLVGCPKCQQSSERDPPRSKAQGCCLCSHGNRVCGILAWFLWPPARCKTSQEVTEVGSNGKAKVATPEVDKMPKADVDATPGDPRAVPVVATANNRKGNVDEESLLDYLLLDLDESLLCGTAFETEASGLFISDEEKNENKSFGMLEIPVILPETYRLTSAVRPTTSGGALQVLVPHQHFPVSIVFDGSYGSGIHLVDGQSYRDNFTNVPERQFTNHQLNSIQITSSPDGLFVDIDGTRLTEYIAPLEKLSLGRGNGHPNSLLPALKVFHRGGFLIEEATIQTSGSNAAKPAGLQRIKLKETEREVPALNCG